MRTPFRPAAGAPAEVLMQVRRTHHRCDSVLMLWGHPAVLLAAETLLLRGAAKILGRYGCAPHMVPVFN